MTATAIPPTARERRQVFSALVPFSGFYGSIHDQAIDDTEEGLFCDSTGNSRYSHLRDVFYMHVDYSEVRERYAKEYVARMRKHFELPSLQFEEIVSPRFYNFQTDRVFAAISRTDLAKILRAVHGKRLNEQIREMFTSRSGFCSSYPNKLNQWPPVDQWDHNHVGAALAAYCERYDEERRFEERTCCDLASDGTIDNWLYGAADFTGRAAIDVAFIKRRLEEEKDLARFRSGPTSCTPAQP